LEFREEKWTFAKVEGGIVNFYQRKMSRQQMCEAQSQRGPAAPVILFSFYFSSLDLSVAQKNPSIYPANLLKFD
jgi:hypothetical protein